MKLKDGFILREVAGENVVIPTGDALDLNMMITLNETGCTLWKRLEQEAELADLTAALLAEYDADEATAGRWLSTSDVTIGDRLTAPIEHQLAALILGRYVATMADGGADIERRLDLLALEGFQLLGKTAGGGIVLAL